MNIINSQKAFWYLLEDNCHIYISINSGCGAMSYPIEFQLNADECQQYAQQGIGYINKLALQTNNEQKHFSTRMLSIDISIKIHELIKRNKAQVTCFTTSAKGIQ